MKLALIVVLCLVCASALRPTKITKVQKARIAEIRKGNTWGSILLNLAELHMMAKGPLEELISAIEDTIQDLEYQRVKRDEAYEKRTEEHNALVQKLTADIANAEQDIEDITGVLEQLAEQKAALEEENRGLVASTAAAREGIAEQTRVRALQHEEYLTKVAETEEAVAAVEECLKILNDFASGSVSFAQVKKAKSTLQMTQNKISKLKGVETAFLNALIAVTIKQEFADPSAIGEVIAKFGEIRQNLYDSSGKLKADEDSNQATFEKYVADNQQLIADNNATIEYNNGLLVENAANTVENQNLLAQRKQDKADFEDELQQENDSYDEATRLYNDWVAENERELGVCNEALEVVSTVNLEDYIGDRVNAKDGLVSSGMATATQHGQGGEVFQFDYDQY